MENRAGGGNNIGTELVVTSPPDGYTMLLVNPANGKEVTVRINDRGPYIDGRCMDLSRGAMTTLGGTSAGVITINYQVLPG